MSKEKRFILRLDARRKAKEAEHKKTKAELLAEEGRRYYNFALPFAIVDPFFQYLSDSGRRPNDWLMDKIKESVIDRD